MSKQSRKLNQSKNKLRWVHFLYGTKKKQIAEQESIEITLLERTNDKKLVTTKMCQI